MIAGPTALFIALAIGVALFFGLMLFVTGGP